MVVSCKHVAPLSLFTKHSWCSLYQISFKHVSLYMFCSVSFLVGLKKLAVVI